MALVSPGVQVTVVDQSNYAPASAGSSAYILLATAQDKIAPGGTAYAAGTLAENAGEIYNITSQRDLINTFGTPIFNTTSTGSALNGDELNEYGLLAAYSALGVSNNLYVQRADIDLNALTGSAIRPLDNPANGTYWLDTSSSAWGVYSWNATTQSFTNQSVTVVSSSDDLVGNLTPNATIGAVGSYAVNVLDPTNPIFYKRYDNTWQLVGNTGWQEGIPTITSNISSTSAVITANGNIVINTTNVQVVIGDTLSNVASAINTASDGSYLSRINVNNQLVITALANAASDGSTVDSKLAISGTPLSEVGLTAGTYNAAKVNSGYYYSVPEFNSIDLSAGTGAPTGSIWLKTSALGSGMNLALKKYSTSNASWDSVTVSSYQFVDDATYGFDPIGGGYNISQNAVFAQFAAYDTFYQTNTISTGGVRLWYRKNAAQSTVVTGTKVSGNMGTPGSSSVFQISHRANLANSTVTTTNVTVTTNTALGLVTAFNTTVSPVNAYLTANITATGAVAITHSAGGDFYLKDITQTPLANVGITSSATNVYALDSDSGAILVGTNWAHLSDLDYYYSSTQPFIAPANNTYWYYNTASRADILYNNGSAWVGYQTVSSDIRGYNLSNTNSTGPIMSASEPTTQDDGTALVYGDLWIDTNDLDNWPALYRWQSVDGINQWVAIDKSDSVSQNGIAFSDVRWATAGNINPSTDAIPSISDLANSSYVDLDAPDATLYPRGILMFNTRASGFNVKQYKSAYFTSAAYPNQTLPTYEGTWVTVAGYDTDSIPNFGRKSQRGLVIAALKSAIDSSTTLREDANQFNLIACPGYPELIPNMVNLNNDRDKTAFIVGDTPFRLPATGTDLQAWANNSNGSGATGEAGLNTSDPYVGLYYPAGQTNDLTGAAVVVPPSHAALRTILNSDNVSYPWIAPAGTRRGLIDNLSAIGYVNSSTGAFVPVGITQGLRDVLYLNKINPLTNLPGTGLVVYGQKTLSDTPSALDRINVARLVNFIRKQLNILSRPFLFEPNDTITRNQLTSVVNGMLNDLVAKRGVTDYLVVCDSSNNTPDRINRNELWVDIAIQPTKDVEFIYIPIRLVAAGQLTGNNIAPAQAVGTGA